MMDDTKDFQEVLEDELRLLRPGGKSRTGKNVHNRILATAGRSRLIGLALSGGGIRSATFNLGVLQALASLKILGKIDYLSTVSGGGYIGTWLTALIHRAQSAGAAADILEADHHRDGHEPHEIGFLREYSNYLTPRKGLLGKDTWTVIATYARNLTLNLVILILALTGLLVIPRLFVSFYYQISSLLSSDQTIIWSLVLFSVAAVGTVANLSNLAAGGEAASLRRKNQSPRLVLLFVILPVFLGTFLLNHWLWFNQLVLSPWWLDWAWVSGLAYALIWTLGIVFGYLFRSKPEAPKSARMDSRPAPEPRGGRRWLVASYRDVTEKARQGLEEVRQPVKRWNIGLILLCALFAGGVGGLLLMGVTNVVGAFSEDYPSRIILGVPLVLVVLQAIATLHIGLTGRGFSDETREWWSRLGGGIALATVSTTAFIFLALYGYLVFDWIKSLGGDQLVSWTTAGWLVTTLSGILAGKSSKTGSPDSSPWLEYLGKVAPYVFVAGLILALEQLVELILGAEIGGSAIGDSPLMMLVSAVVCLAAAFALSWRIGVNDFSMHALYRNRLVRCYLGASNGRRNPQPYTDFDPSDDAVRLQDLPPGNSSARFVGPYPIVNATLNLVTGKRLAWQQRKAASFVFTPLYAGYEHIVDPLEERSDDKRLSGKGFRPSAWYGDALTLGNAMAISGAAASPNMGSHSSVPLAFLMTVFNVRLGWWLGNSRYHIEKPRWRSGPPVGLFYLFFELLGKTNDASRYVYVSDGGHFENLGIYELVRRRCSLIIASDAGEDHGMKFGDLGNAIEKCRTDFGVNIDINVSAIRNRDEQGNSESHFAVGRIRYDLVDPQIPEGMLLYLKSSLTGNEPADVLRYKAQHKEFPHQTTADQWFNESQFESYRTLGYAALCSTFEPTRSRVQKGDLHGAIRTLARSQMEKRETGRAQR